LDDFIRIESENGNADTAVMVSAIEPEDSWPSLGGSSGEE
jgi:hypothetical protein